MCEGGDWSRLGAEPQDFITDTLVAARAGLVADSGLTWPGPFEIVVILMTDEAMREVNRDHRQQDKPTNVLSFPVWELEDLELLAAGTTPPGQPPGVPVPLGDILMAEATLTREAALQGKSFADHARHLLVHGFLHLVGYDHMNDDEAEVMEALEVQILRGFAISDPYQDREQIVDSHE
nr:rRNA maturation RNase YbeY [Govania unica]